MRLGDVLQQQHRQLDNMFGEGAYQIEVNEPDQVRVRTGWMELLLVYDHRDQFV